MELYPYHNTMSHQEAFALASQDELHWTDHDRQLLEAVAQHLLTHDESNLVVGSITTYPVENVDFHIMRRRSGGFGIGITRFSARQI